MSNNVPNPNGPAEPLALVADCEVCGGLLDYVTEKPDPGWWRHRNVADLEPPHVTTPIRKRTEPIGGAR